VDVELAAERVDPNAAIVGGRGNVRGTVDQHGVSGLDALEEFSDMNVGMALRPGGTSVDGESPIVTPELPGFGDGGAPELEALGGGERGERMSGRVM
jgi:hypothetical protein